MEVDSEFAFELRVCRWAERSWPPGGEPMGGPATAGDAVVIARQLGTARRRWDTIVLECDPEGLDARAAFGEERLDSDLLPVVRHAPAEWAWYREALPEPDYPWRYVREAVNRAADRGVLGRRKRDGRVEIRRTRPYPDWVDRVVAIENKPDLDAAAARDLADQLRRDVALGLADEVWVATAATDDRVPPALFEDLPPEAGILTLSADGTVRPVWLPRRLAVDEPGTRILENPDEGRSAARFEYVDPTDKRAKRREIAERAYERGWRSYADATRPDCRHYELRREGEGGWLLPHCAAKGRVPTPAECGSACGSFEPEPPAWRTRGWPIEGGPGAGIRRLLEDRRRRRR